MTHFVQSSLHKGTQACCYPEETQSAVLWLEVTTQYLFIYLYLYLTKERKQIYTRVNINSNSQNNQVTST